MSQSDKALLLLIPKALTQFQFSMISTMNHFVEAEALFDDHTMNVITYDSIKGWKRRL